MSDIDPAQLAAWNAANVRARRAHESHMRVLEKVRRPWGTIDPAEVKRLFDLGMPRREIAKRLNCHESSLYRVLKKAAS